MLSKAVIKNLNALQIKKYRNIQQAFVVEGAKSVLELLQSDFEINELYVTENFLSKNSIIKQQFPAFQIVTEAELAKAGTYESNNAALAVAKFKQFPELKIKKNELVLALDQVRDPGNLGTIIRIADWYGVSKIICSPDCVDFYNPKVIAASMGSFTRIQVYYEELVSLFQQLENNIIVYGAALAGENLHHQTLPPNGVIVMGNEANGISPEVLKMVKQKLTIPAFGDAESLNVAIATAVILDNFRRNS